MSTVLTDDQLFASYLSGDDEAFTTLYDRHATHMKFVMGTFIRDEHRAEDIVQIAFCKVHDNRHSYQLGTDFKKWLYSIGYNVAIDQSRLKKLESVASLDALIGTEDGMDNYADIDVRETVIHVLDKLLPSDRKVIRMFYFDGMPHQDIAAVLNINEANARYRLSAALAKFREAWRKSQPKPKFDS